MTKPINIVISDCQETHIVIESLKKSIEWQKGDKNSKVSKYLVKPLRYYMAPDAYDDYLEELNSSKK